jgi:hypothetical protein
MGNTSDPAGGCVEITETSLFRGDFYLVRRILRLHGRADDVLPVTLDHGLPKTRSVLAVEWAGKSASSTSEHGSNEPDYRYRLGSSFLGCCQWQLLEDDAGQGLTSQALAHL